MKTKFLLPHYFKRIGYILFALGLIIWCGIQLNIIEIKIQYFIKVLILSISFFSFLFGFYAIIFSQEKIEDEFINITRLKSFQVSSIIQFFFFILSFFVMFVFKIEPKGDSGLASLFLLAIVIYWIVYVFYFNLSLLRNKIKFNEE